MTLGDLIRELQDVARRVGENRDVRVHRLGCDQNGITYPTIPRDIVDVRYQGGSAVEIHT